MGLRGSVANMNNGVEINVALDNFEKQLFLDRIKTEKPQTAEIFSIDIEPIEGFVYPYFDFTILSGSSQNEEITRVAPDIAVCDDCLADRKTQPHRIAYPFINCTNCGPRFSIVRDLPYDRCRTTMADFRMCRLCETEYCDANDRRFHAQPVACNTCGPQYYIENEENTYENILQKSVDAINAGKIIAIRGIGGYHLVCDATDEQAVSRLRQIKARDTKPFAVMFRNIEAIKQYVAVNETERENLVSWRRPIVICHPRKGGSVLSFPRRRESQYSIAFSSGDSRLRGNDSQINPGMKTLGCMLPYMPIHYDWFERIETPVIVMTSGNFNDRPIIISPEEANKELGSLVDLLIHHNRLIHNRVDDSVLQVCGDKTCLIRRSRGYAPEPFATDIETEGILAFGAEKVNTFALGKGNSIIQSQYIGDLKNEETFTFYTESMQRFEHLFRFKPQILACDLHPDYLSSVYAEKIAFETGLPLLRVQHHHAHAAACMLEYGLNNPVAAVVWDGIGLGDDGAAWGGEFFICDRQKYTRIAHLEYVPMPGGDQATHEPWRMAVAWLKHYNIPLPKAFSERIGEEKIKQIENMIEKNINCPPTSSMGRLFDAVASLTGICDYASRQGEGAILLEQQIADHDCELSYPTDAENSEISFKSVFEGIVFDLNLGISKEIISFKFHNSLVSIILNRQLLYFLQYFVKDVIISGGCFQNKYLVEQLQKKFAETPLTLYVPSRIPCNDGGIAAGQLTIAAANRLK